jgi:flagellar protein FlaH
MGTQIIPLPTPELNKAFGGGIPTPSLISIEGDHGSGKTVISQYILYSMLKQGINSIAITTETTTKEYVKMMKTIKLDVTREYLTGKLKVYSLHIREGAWSKHLAPYFLQTLTKFVENKNSKIKCILIDDLSSLSLNVENTQILTFITRTRNLITKGKTVILTFHPNFIDPEVARVVKASSEVYLTLENKTIGGIQVKTLRIVKLWGSSGERTPIINLEINPTLGLRVLPIGEVTI